MSDRNPCDFCGTQNCPGGEVDPCKEYVYWKEQKNKHREPPRKVRISDLPATRPKSPMPPVKAPKGTLEGRKIKTIQWAEAPGKWHNYNLDKPTISSVVAHFFELTFPNGTVEWVNQDEILRFTLE